MSYPVYKFWYTMILTGLLLILSVKNKDYLPLKTSPFVQIEIKLSLLMQNS